MEIFLSSVPIIAEGIKVRKESFGQIVVSKRTPILTMNEDAVNIWNAIDGTCTVSEIISSMKATYDISEEEISQVVLMFLDSCNRLGLVEIKNS